MTMVKKHAAVAALVVSCAALVTSLTGTAVSLPGKNNVKSKNLPRNVVKPRHLATNSVTPRSLRRNAVRTGHIGGGAVKASKLGALTTALASSPTVDNGVTESATATCPAGTRVISGGVRGQQVVGGIFSISNWRVRQSEMSGNGWVVSGTNQTGTAGRIQARAYCLRA